MTTYKRASNDKATLKIEHDNHPSDPRQEMDGWVGEMVCWHKRYSLGDTHNYSEPRDFLEHLAKDYYKGDEDVDDLTVTELMDTIAPHVIILPLYLYDHGGITISTGSFGDRWDSGQVGWIFATKDKFREETGYNEDELFSTDTKRAVKVGDQVKVKGYENDGLDGWVKVVSFSRGMVQVDRDHHMLEGFKRPDSWVIVHEDSILEVMSNKAVQMLEAEVEIYDQYLTGSVYGFILEIKNPCHCGNPECTRHEVEVDSCWGFYGNDFIKNGIAEHIAPEYRELLEALS